MIEVLTRMRLPIVPVLPDEVARKADLITGETVNYSLAPVDTGVKWIDGQPVFRRVFIAVSGAAVNTNTAIIHVPGAGWGFFGLVRLDGFITTSTEDRVPLSFYADAADYIGVKIASNSDIIERHGATTMNSRPMILIVDYISQPTGTSSWDGGVTAWDTGTSTWDQMSRQAQPLWDSGDAIWDRR